MKAIVPSEKNAVPGTYRARSHAVTRLLRVILV